MCFGTNQGKRDRDATPSGLGSVSWYGEIRLLLSFKRGKDRKKKGEDFGRFYFQEDIREKRRVWFRGKKVSFSFVLKS